MMRISRKAQQTAEYAIVLGLVVGAVVAMQVYVKRGLQGRIKQFSAVLPNETEIHGLEDQGYGEIDFDTQYEPYYLASNFTVERTSGGSGLITPDGDTHTFRNATSETERAVGGYQEYEYNPEEDEFILRDILAEEEEE